MDVSGPVVYLPPQAIDPLSPSRVPIAMALVASPDLTARSRVALASLEKLSAASEGAGAATRGAVDLFA